jgi:hypothetical protein
MMAFSDVASCNLFEVWRRFRGALFIAVTLVAVRTVDMSFHFSETAWRYAPEVYDLQCVKYHYES